MEKSFVMADLNHSYITTQFNVLDNPPIKVI